jgi:ribonuclease G
MALEEEAMERLERQTNRLVYLFVNPASAPNHFTITLRPEEGLLSSFKDAEFVCSVRELLPQDEPMFAVYGNRLVRLSGRWEDKEVIAVRITADGRWWCEGGSFGCPVGSTGFEGTGVGLTTR